MESGTGDESNNRTAVVYAVIFHEIAKDAVVFELRVDEIKPIIDDMRKSFEAKRKRRESKQLGDDDDDIGANFGKFHDDVLDYADKHILSWATYENMDTDVSYHKFYEKYKDIAGDRSELLKATPAVITIRKSLDQRGFTGPARRSITDLVYRTKNASYWKKMIEENPHLFAFGHVSSPFLGAKPDEPGTDTRRFDAKSDKTVNVDSTIGDALSSTGRRKSRSDASPPASPSAADLSPSRRQSRIQSVATGGPDEDTVLVDSGIAVTGPYGDLEDDGDDDTTGSDVSEEEESEETDDSDAELVEVGDVKGSGSNGND